MSVLSTIRNTFTTQVRQPISEIIGRISTRLRLHFPSRFVTDYTQTDYEYWDKLRRGKQRGFEIGGLFAQPIAQIDTSWTVGDGFLVDSGHDNTNERIAEFLRDELQAIVETVEDHYALGDAYIVVNADGSLTQVPASQVEITHADDDIRQIVSVIIKSHNQETAVSLTDVYTNTERTITIERGGQKTEQIFPNLIGRIPVVHFANGRGANEVYGRPEYESLLTLFAEYDDVIRKGLDGVKLMGNPYPVFENLKDPGAAKESDKLYDKQATDAQGTSQTEDVVELPEHGVLYTSGVFNFKSPGNFTPNTTDMLKKLFQLMLQHSRIPEWAWGGAIASSMASVQAQLPAFTKVITGRRRKMEKPIKSLLDIWRLTIALSESGIDTTEPLELTWPQLVAEDGEIRLKWVQHLDSQSYLSRETVLALSDLVDNPSGELEKADAETEVQADTFQQGVDDSIARMLQSDGAANGASGNGAVVPNEQRAA